MAIHSIELCAGVGMLGEGVRAAFKHLGFEHRTVCYVEREASAASQLVALMEAGAIHSAPIWDDLTTFDGAAWRGRVDCVIAGFPCQDLSVAGRRAGLDGKRSGLFFNVADIADACGARFLILENVAGIASASASVVDETEGKLEERAAARVLGELADRGWDAEWMHLRASDVGANHQRDRWFCLAWRGVAYADDDGSQGRGISAERGWDERSHSQRTGAAMGDARCECDGANKQERFAECGSSTDACTCGCELGDAARDGWNEGWPESAWERRRFNAPQHGGAVGNSNEQREQQPHDEDGSDARKRSWDCAGGTSGGHDELFAPGPLDDRWAGIIAQYPWLAPATKSSICGVAYGLADWLDGDVNGENTKTSERDQQGGYPQTSSAERVAAWRKMLQVRLNGMLAETSPQLLEANGDNDPLLKMPSRDGSCGRHSGPCGCGELRDLRFRLSAEEGAALKDLFQFGVFGHARKIECGKEMEGRSHRLRMCGNGVVPLQAATALVILARRAGIF